MAVGSKALHYRPMASRIALLIALVMAQLGIGSMAQANEGPGYGGNADELTVTWLETPDVQAAGEGLGISGGGLELAVFGLGFRGKSEVSVSVGESTTLDTRVDQTGTLDATVPAQQVSDKAAPGTSVIVIGRAPSGAVRTLVGAVPPLPSGTSPADLVPFFALTGLVVALVIGVARRTKAPR